MFAVYTKGEAE